jgi:hypothetical protein
MLFITIVNINPADLEFSLYPLHSAKGVPEDGRGLTSKVEMREGLDRLSEKSAEAVDGSCCRLARELFKKNACNFFGFLKSENIEKKSKRRPPAQAFR